MAPITRLNSKPERRVFYGKTVTPRRVKQECTICASTHAVHQFKVRKYAAHSCEHLDTICSFCIRRILKAKVTERQLDHTGLACPFPDCDVVVEFAALKGIAGPAAFKDYEESVFKHFLSTDPSFHACLSPTCGKVFSVEDCLGKGHDKLDATCPYCAYHYCTECHRSWDSHGDSGDCDKVKADELKLSEDTLKSIGAKPCPSCGINILKTEGCDHMHCRACNTHFCWLCLGRPYGSTTHRPNCPLLPRIARDVRNWVAGHLDMHQINELIRRGPHPGPGPAMHQPVPPVPNPNLGGFNVMQAPPPFPGAGRGGPPAQPQGFFAGQGQDPVLDQAQAQALMIHRFRAWMAANPIGRPPGPPVIPVVPPFIFPAPQVNPPAQQIDDAMQDDVALQVNAPAQQVDDDEMEIPLADQDDDQLLAVMETVADLLEFL